MTLTYSHDAANVLYHVVTQRHQARRSMIFTSNKHPDGWGRVLHDDDLAAAIVDRVLERGRLLQLDGPSMRTKHLGLDAPAHAAAGSAPVARISGIVSPEFPEPTSGGPLVNEQTERAVPIPGAVLRDVVISIDPDLTATTNSRGYAVLSSIPPGSHIVRFADGTMTGELTVELAEGIVTGSGARALGNFLGCG